MMKYLILLLILSFNLSSLYSQELRATWIARDNFSTKIALSQAMDSLAKNNFNTVYINCWSRGYPLWKSKVFFRETGIYSDPVYGDRDIVAEAIAEGHRLGLHVEAWFEYGFVGGWTGNLPAGKKGPIFENHPDWVAKKLDGSEIDGSNFYWMVQTRKDVQDFLIELCTELCRNYDLDGIELDRIRYSSTSYGYDFYTDSLYKTENNNQPIPTNPNDQGWIKWRADKLNEFISRVYDSLKNINPYFNISNAPSLYSSSNYTSYYDYCQDWFWWVNNNKVDNVQVQSYVTSAQSFGNILDFIKTKINNIEKVYPAFAVAPGSTPLQDNVIYQLIDITRQKGFKGNSIWYYKDLVPFLNKIKTNRYDLKTYPPNSIQDWREYFSITKLSDTTMVTKSGNWIKYFVQGYENFIYYNEDTSPAFIEYNINVPLSGYYEIYAFQVTASDRTPNAKYIITDSNYYSREFFVDQSKSSNSRWYKLGDCFLIKGLSKVVKITNDGLPLGKKINADAIMIILNRGLNNKITGVKKEFEINQNKKFKKDIRLNNFPNPFNNSTTIDYYNQSGMEINLSIYNLLGEKLLDIQKQDKNTGNQRIYLDMNSFPAGVYICRLTQGKSLSEHKILLLK